MKKIKIAIAGVGNCSSSLVQGINYYKYGISYKTAAKAEVEFKPAAEAVKEDELNERDFYIIMGAKAKSMNQERRERTLLLNESLIKEGKKR